MNRIATLLAAVTVIALTAGVMAGCTLQIRMNPASAVELTGRRIPAEIKLFMDREFQNYHWQGFSDAELRGLDYDLGSASKNLFLRAFTLTSDGVAVIETGPAYPIAGRGDIVLVVHPRIGAFTEKHSLFIRNANYYAEITYHVTVYDKTGRIILEKDYPATGVEMGSADLHRNYAAPAEKAMVQAVVQILDDIAKLATPKIPGHGAD